MEEILYNCPYCGEELWAEIDHTATLPQHSIEDCEVCCKPVHIMVRAGKDGVITLEAKTEDEGW